MGLGAVREAAGGRGGGAGANVGRSFRWEWADILKRARSYSVTNYGVTDHTQT